MQNERLLTEAEEQLRRMRVPEALLLFDLAEQAKGDPDSCAGGRWICHMLLGSFESAWRESDGITHRANPDLNRFWDGQPQDGRKVLVRCHHGLGDTIQFVRYAPLVRRMARSLAIEAQPSLKALLAAAHLADEVFTWGEPEPAWDQQIEIVELPRIFRTTLSSLPNEVPYLQISSPAAVRSREASQCLQVGVVWASSGYNSARSIPIERFSRIFSIPGVQFFSLQASNERTQIEPWSDQIASLYDESACALRTSRILTTLDLIITVDTMIAHLAGALGRPVWTLLPFECDWRWMLHREDSPWYPTMRLFRQPRPGDWDFVIERVQRELHALVSLSENRAALEFPDPNLSPPGPKPPGA